MDIRIQYPFLVMKKQYSATRTTTELVLMSENERTEDVMLDDNFDSYDGDMEFDEYREIDGERGSSNMESETMFVLFDYDTMNLVGNDNEDVRMFETAHEAYKYSGVDSEEDFASHYAVFQVPHLTKQEVEKHTHKAQPSFGASLKIVTDKPITTGWKTH